MNKARQYAEALIVVGSFWLVAYLTALCSLGFVELTAQCEHCGAETALRNLWSHLRWHIRCGEWDRRRK